MTRDINAITQGVNDGGTMMDFDFEHIINTATHEPLELLNEYGE